jgi:AcrR family transcriptional regulator
MRGTVGGGAPVPQQERSVETRRRLLDAAVDELVAVGYAHLTTAGVARRAGVSRGAQQHHFPNKTTLVTEAIGHLGSRQLAELREVGARIDSPSKATEEMLDAVFAAYSQPLFMVTLELAIASRVDPDLRDAVATAERAFNREIADLSAAIVDELDAARPEFIRTFAMVLSTVRGVALLKVLGHSEKTVQRHWTSTRAELLANLESRR